MRAFIVPALAMSALLGACSDLGSADLDNEIAKQFKKQFNAVCSLELAKHELGSDAKMGICECAGEKLLAATDIPTDSDTIPRVSLNKEEIVPAVNQCATDAGIDLELAE